MSDWELSRRDFLQKTAYAAGLAGMANVLPVDTLLSQAAQASTRLSRLPSPRNVEIDHFVFLMMENRSFDHYFGWLTGDADGRQHQTFRDPAGHPVATRHASSLGSAEWQGCGHMDPGHGWTQGRAQLNGGFLAPGSGNDDFALCYYNQGELPLIHAAARQYTMYDRYFASILSSTFPNRYYKWSGQSGGKVDNDLAAIAAEGGNKWETIFDRAIPRGVSARYYASDLPFSATWGARGVAWTNPIERFYTDCAAGALPNISIVDPPFKDGSGGNGISADEHPLGDVRLGQAFVSDVVHAFQNSKNYKRGALFLIYDEWGGFFDHVRPPHVIDDRATRNLDTDFGQMGFRVPAVTISPYTRGRGSHYRVDHGIYGHESILKLISYRFGLGYLNKRHSYARNIGHSFDWEHPDFTPAPLPDPAQVASTPCSLSRSLAEDPGQNHAGDLAELEQLAHRFRFPVYESGPDQIFTAPSKLKGAFAEQ